MKKEIIFRSTFKVKDILDGKAATQKQCDEFGNTRRKPRTLLKARGRNFLTR
jgi:hypothetical protein